MVALDLLDQWWFMDCNSFRVYFALFCGLLTIYLIGHILFDKLMTWLTEDFGKEE